MIFLNDIDRSNYYNCKSDLPHVSRAHSHVSEAMQHLQKVDPLCKALTVIQIELKQRIDIYETEIKAIEQRAKEHKKAVTA